MSTAWSYGLGLPGFEEYKSSLSPSQRNQLDSAIQKINDAGISGAMDHQTAQAIGLTDDECVVLANAPHNRVVHLPPALFWPDRHY